MRARVAMLVVFAFVVAGCDAVLPGPTPLVVCNAFTYADGAVAGTLRINGSAAWLDGADGGPLVVEWPPEVEVRADGLYARDTGRRLVAADGWLRLIQTPWSSASGTGLDPYRPGWCDFYDVF